MNESRKKSRWAIRMIVGLPLLYILSFGPAARIADHWDAAIPVLSVVYRPAIRLACACGCRTVVYWYGMDVWGAGKIVDHRFVQEALVP